MKNKRIAILIFCVILCVLCAACNTSAPSPSPELNSSAPSPSPSPLPAVSPAETDISGEASETDSADSLPLTMDIPVVREGSEEMLPASLTVSDMGYSIYLFEDFTLTVADDGDVIHPSEASPIMQTICMLIVRSNGESPLPENTESEGLVTEYRRINHGAYTFDVTIFYPSEAAEGGTVLLYTMLNTLITSR